MRQGAILIAPWMSGIQRVRAAYPLDLQNKFA
jgi:hypothetical protein